MRKVSFDFTHYPGHNGVNSFSRETPFWRHISYSDFPIDVTQNMKTYSDSSLREDYNEILRQGIVNFLHGVIMDKRNGTKCQFAIKNVSTHNFLRKEMRVAEAVGTTYTRL